MHDPFTILIMDHPNKINAASPLSFKIILLGDSNVGKTCFLRQFIDHEFPLATKPTIHVDFVAKTYQIDEFCVQLFIFDTAGQERHRSLTRAYFKGTDAVLFMYSMESKKSFENVVNWIKYFEAESEERQEVRVLVGTKKDLLDNVHVVQDVKRDENPQSQRILKSQIKQLVQTNHFIFKFQTSAKANLNINIVFEELSRNLIYNSIQRRKTGNKIQQGEWGGILKRDKEHLLRQSERKGGCC